MVSRTPPPTQTSSGLGGGNSLTTISPSLPDRRLAFSSSTWMVLTPKPHCARLEAEHGALPATVEAITARGRHIYFKWPQEPVRNSAGKIGRHIDVRGDGGYVLCPPSIHPSGRRIAGASIVRTASRTRPAGYWPNKMAVTVGTTPSSEWRSLIEGVDEGARNCSLARLAGHLLRHHVNAFVTLGLLQAWNATNCKPPLPAAEVEQIVNSIAGKELRRRGNG